MMNFELKKKLLQTSFEENLCHIPSALSMLDYWSQLDKFFSWKKDDCLVVGKPYGSLAYHLVWNDGYVGPITGYDKNVKWCDSTLANCLGVAVGLAIGGKNKNVVVNLGDGALQEGTILEAASFCGRCKEMLASRIVLAIDCNGWQCISKTKSSPKQTQQMFSGFGWKCIALNGHSSEDLAQLKHMLEENGDEKALCFIFKTTKGKGVKFIEDDPIGWHYKKLDASTLEKAIECLKKEDNETNN